MTMKLLSQKNSPAFDVANTQEFVLLRHSQEIPFVWISFHEPCQLHQDQQYKKFRCSDHDSSFELNLYQEDLVNKHHWRLNIARPAKDSDLSQSATVGKSALRHFAIGRDRWAGLSRKERTVSRVLVQGRSLGVLIHLAILMLPNPPHCLGDSDGKVIMIMATRLVFLPPFIETKRLLHSPFPSFLSHPSVT